MQDPTYHPQIEQGSDEWLSLRLGLITASEVNLILTPTLKVAANDKTRQHVYELAAQRLTGYVEPHYIGDDMLRGKEDEIKARDLYGVMCDEVSECGFITRDIGGTVIGYSPDGLVGDAGLIEAKSRRQKHHLAVMCASKVPDEHVLQCQTGLLVTGRKWLDYISYCGGMPMTVLRVFPDPVVHAAIIAAAQHTEGLILEAMETYAARIKFGRTYPTERTVEQEMMI